MNATHQLGGENYVLWGGREGYETCSTPICVGARARNWPLYADGGRP